MSKNYGKTIINYFMQLQYDTLSHETLYFKKQMKYAL